MCKALANRLLALSNRFYKLSMLSLAFRIKTRYFSQNKFYYTTYISTRTACTNAFSSHSDSWYLVSQTCFHFKNLLYFIAGTTRDVFIRNTMNRRNYYNAHSSTFCTILTAYFTSSENFKNAVLAFSIT